MNETKTTLWFMGVAAVLVILAVIAAPRRITPGAFLDQGEPFFPKFTDPNEAVSLEVIDYDEQTASAKPFKVTFQGGRWTIPSHHDYPADAKDRLAKAAAGIIDIKKDDFRSDNVADHEVCGVLDPLDETAGLSGRGQRVTIKGGSGEVLADLILGKEVQGRTGFRFVRVPKQKRVYAAKVDVDVSTAFADWIDTDLLQVSKSRINRIVFNDYSINERTRSVERRDNIVLQSEGGKWKVDGMKSSQEVDTNRVNQVLSALDSLAIVGVRPKPEGLSASLTQLEDGTKEISMPDQMSLQSKGFYLSRDGQLLSNEGELKVHTSDGILYTLRFGEVVYGSGTDITAGADAGEAEQTEASENRYLFVTSTFDAGEFPEPPQAANTDFQDKADSLWTDEDRQNKELYDTWVRWKNRITRSAETNEKLNDRFAAWYYVISADDFEKLRLKRADLLKTKES